MKLAKVSPAWNAAWRSLGVLTLGIALILGLFVQSLALDVLAVLSGICIGYPPSLWKHGWRLSQGIAPEKYAYYVLMKPTERNPETETVRYMGFVEKEIK